MLLAQGLGVDVLAPRALALLELDPLLEATSTRAMASSRCCEPPPNAGPPTWATRTDRTRHRIDRRS
ncbi:hypothetical protein ACWDKQ_21160 [Saccharopolyspora sp. NPDC000995]